MPRYRVLREWVIEADEVVTMSNGVTVIGPPVGERLAALLTDDKCVAYSIKRT